MHLSLGRGPRVGLGAAALAAALTLTPASAFAAGPNPTTAKVDAITPVERAMQPFTVTATITGSGAPLTGTVTIVNDFSPFETTWQAQLQFLGQATCDGAPICTVTVPVSGRTLLPTPAVNHVVARYGGDVVHAESESPRVDVTGLGWAATTPTVTPRSTTTVYGQPLVIDASLALDAPASWPDGSWYNRTYAYAGDVSSGRSIQGVGNPTTITFPGLTAGSHQIVVDWRDASIFPYPVRVPAPVTFTHVVQKASTTLDLAAESPRPGDARLSAKLATVAPGAGAGTGEVTFTEGDTVLGRANVGGDGVASIDVALPAGEHTVRAAYSGDGNFEASQSAPRAVTVAGAGGGPTPPQPGELLRVDARPSGKIVARVRCAEGRATLTAKLDGRVFAQRSVRCKGRRMRIVLRPQQPVAKGQQVRVSVRFTEGGRATTKVQVPRRG